MLVVPVGLHCSKVTQFLDLSNHLGAYIVIKIDKLMAKTTKIRQKLMKTNQ